MNVWIVMENVIAISIGITCINENRARECYDANAGCVTGVILAAVILIAKQLLSGVAHNGDTEYSMMREMISAWLWSRVSLL